jgi:hypothetical protein
MAVRAVKVVCELPIGSDGTLGILSRQWQTQISDKLFLCDGEQKSREVTSLSKDLLACHVSKRFAPGGRQFKQAPSSTSWHEPADHPAVLQP